MIPTVVTYSPLCRLHDPGPNHPESMARYDAVLNGIAAQVPPDRLRRIETPPADEAVLRLCHSADYVALVRREVADGSGALSTGDVDVCAHSMTAALAAVGTVLGGVEQVLSGAARTAFCVARPPGHHASTDRGDGFCLFNNLAIGVRWAQQRYGLGRVLVVDWDVHHGNGTQDLFYTDPSVFFFSLHQWLIYPGTGTVHQIGEGAGRGFTCNCPLAMGAGGREVLDAMRTKLVPAMRQFRPECIFVSAGFDGHAADPLAALNLNAADFGEMTGVVRELADTYAAGRVISVLEGGYHLEALAESAGVHVRVLSGAPVDRAGRS